METLNKILDLPVIIQGALGSFLFWLLYESCKRFFLVASKFVAKHNRRMRHEVLVYERMQAIAMTSGDPNDRFHMILGCIYCGLSHAIKGLIYICFGLVTRDLLGPMSLIAYGFSIVYFYRAYGAVALEFNSGKSNDDYEKRIKEIDAEIAILKQGV